MNEEVFQKQYDSLVEETENFLDNWYKNNGSIDAGESKKLAQFMDDFGEYVDNMDYTPKNNGDKLVLYSGMNGEIPMYKYAEGASETGTGHYYISSTKPGRILNNDTIQNKLKSIFSNNEELKNKIYCINNVNRLLISL